MNTDKLSTARRITRLVISASVGATVGILVRNNTPGLSPIEKAEVLIGSSAISMMLAAKAADHVDSVIQEIADANADVNLTVVS